MERNDDQGPAGGITAHLTIRDNRAAEAIDFYKNAFGAELAMDPFMADDGKRIMHAHLTINGGHLMLNDDFPEYGGAASAPGASRFICRSPTRTPPGAARSPPAARRRWRSPTSSGATAMAS